jgi:alpha-D-ribose 1-methylphosphonate 5-triphosphate synthase subunit PhnH
MDAMARPGSVAAHRAGSGTPHPMMRGTAAIALTLFDHDTPLWLDPPMSRDLGSRQNGSNSTPARL